MFSVDRMKVSLSRRSVGRLVGKMIETGAGDDNATRFMLSGARRHNTSEDIHTSSDR